MNKITSKIGDILLNRKLVSIFVLLVVIFTLAVDIAGMVHPCPYCRTQRAALGILALIMLLPMWQTVIFRYLAFVSGFYGLTVGVMQNFNHVRRMNSGDFDWSGLSIGHPWILSGLAVLAMSWQLFLIFNIAQPRK